MRERRWNACSKIASPDNVPPAAIVVSSNDNCLTGRTDIAENDVAVVQCAGGKTKDARTFKSPGGKPVQFAAHPEHAPNDGEYYANPDDMIDDNARERQPRRQMLQHYNENDSSRIPVG